MVYPLVTAGVAFLMALVAGSPIIAFLRERKVGKDIRPEGPESHAMKQGTPTMGGIIILIPVVITTLLLNAQGRSVYFPLATLVANGLVGLSDDVRSLVGRAGGGFFGGGKGRGGRGGGGFFWGGNVCVDAGSRSQRGAGTPLRAAT